MHLAWLGILPNTHSLNLSAFFFWLKFYLTKGATSSGARNGKLACLSSEAQDVLRSESPSSGCALRLFVTKGLCPFELPSFLFAGVPPRTPLVSERHMLY